MRSLARLARAWPQAGTETETLALYAEQLQHVGEVELREAVDALIRTKDFFPSIASVLGAVRDYRAAHPPERPALPECSEVLDAAGLSPDEWKRLLPDRSALPKHLPPGRLEQERGASEAQVWAEDVVSRTTAPEPAPRLTPEQTQAMVAQARRVREKLNPGSEAYDMRGEDHDQRESA